MASFTGRLHDKRKEELQNIVDELNLRSSLPPGRQTKYDLQEAIRAELKSNRAAREDVRFEGLWAAMPESKKSHEGQEPIVLVETSGPSIGSPRKSLPVLHYESTHEGAPAAEDAAGAVPTSFREAILNTHIVDTLLHRNGYGDDGDELALVPVSTSLRRRASQVVRRGSTSLRVAAHETVGFMEEAQVKASQPWVVVGGILAAELAFIVYEAVPWVDKHFGPHTWLHRAPTPAFTLHLPVLSVLLHRTFFAALVLWALTTYLLPLLLATFFSFPTHADRRIRRHARSGSANKSLAHLAPPNPLIFTLARFALALLRGYVLAPSTASPVGIVKNLSTALREIAAGGPGSLGLAGGRYSFEGAVHGVWGVVAVGMGVGAAVSAYAESRV
ncbi:hypothetical protein JCM3770_006702 [Rhodotorula araucariae]